MRLRRKIFFSCLVDFANFGRAAQRQTSGLDSDFKLCCAAAKNFFHIWSILVNLGVFPPPHQRITKNLSLTSHFDIGNISAAQRGISGSKHVNHFRKKPQFWIGAARLVNTVTGFFICRIQFRRQKHPEEKL